MPQRSDEAVLLHLCFAVVDASSFDDVSNYVGDKVELIGQVIEVKHGSSRRGHKPYCFVNFGNWRDDCVRLTLWQEGLNEVAPDESWKGQWIVANGMVDPIYHGSNRWGNVTYKSIGITITHSSQLHKISREEALWRLGKGQRGRSNAPSSTQSNNDNILESMRQKVDLSAPLRPANQPVSRPAFQTVSRPNPPSQRQQQAVVPQSTKEKNDAILQSLSQSGSSSGPKVTTPVRPPQVQQPTGGSSGCVLALLLLATNFFAASTALILLGRMVIFTWERW